MPFLFSSFLLAVFLSLIFFPLSSFSHSILHQNALLPKKRPEVIRRTSTLPLKRTEKKGMGMYHFLDAMFKKKTKAKVGDSPRGSCSTTQVMKEKGKERDSSKAARAKTLDAHDFHKEMKKSKTPKQDREKAEKEKEKVERVEKMDKVEKVDKVEKERVEKEKEKEKAEREEKKKTKVIKKKTKSITFNSERMPSDMIDPVGGSHEVSVRRGVELHLFDSTAPKSPVSATKKGKLESLREKISGAKLKSPVSGEPPRDHLSPDCLSSSLNTSFNLSPNFHMMSLSPHTSTSPESGYSSSSSSSSSGPSSPATGIMTRSGSRVEKRERGGKGGDGPGSDPTFAPLSVSHASSRVISPSLLVPFSLNTVSPQMIVDVGRQWPLRFLLNSESRYITELSDLIAV
jgi:hypothetical protein